MTDRHLGRRLAAATRRSLVAGTLFALCTGCTFARRPALVPTPARTPLSASTVEPDLPAVQSDAGAGSQYFHVYCTSCHGQTGAGDGPAAAALRPRPTDFRDAAYMRDQTPAWYYRALTQGVTGTAMGRWDVQLDSTAQWDTVFYVWSLSTRPQDLATGRAMYGQRCRSCHGADGRGVPQARLDDPARVQESRASVAEAIRTAHPELVGGLASDALPALVEYIWTFLYAPAPESADGATPPPRSPNAATCAVTPSDSGLRTRGSGQSPRHPRPEGAVSTPAQGIALGTGAVRDQP